MDGRILGDRDWEKIQTHLVLKADLIRFVMEQEKTQSEFKKIKKRILAGEFILIGLIIIYLILTYGK